MMDLLVGEDGIVVGRSKKEPNFFSEAL